jgi:hypothetical protein
VVLFETLHTFVQDLRDRLHAAKDVAELSAELGLIRRSEFDPQHPVSLSDESGRRRPGRSGADDSHVERMPQLYTTGR